MPESRCDFILLGWTAFVAFNLISGLIWGGDGTENYETENSSGFGKGGLTVSSLAEPSTGLFRGSYRILFNGTLVDEGLMRMLLVSKKTGAMSVRVSSMEMAVLEPGGYSSLASAESGLTWRALEVGSAGRLTATGKSDPARFSLFGREACTLDTAVNIQRSEEALAADLDPDDERPHVSSMMGEILACGFVMTFQAEVVDVVHLTQKVFHYSIWVNLLTILQMRFFLGQMRYTDEGPSAAKVSLICIAVQAMMDAYDAFLHLFLGLKVQYMFNTIAVVALFKFILFSLVEARYLLTIWRQRRHDAFGQGWESVRRELSWLYSRFYGVLIMGLIIIYNNLQHLSLVALIFQCYWIPQIVNDAWQGSRSALRPTFLAGISVSRALVPLYLWGCPHGIFSGELFPRLPGSPSFRMCAYIILIQGCQVAIVFSQKAYGSRWFIPRFFRPQAYNYYRSVTIESGTECVICMSEIDPEDARKVSTPCNHIFHHSCLEQWMDVKMECPTCRASLPAIQ